MQATEDEVVALMSALGSIIAYVREDEQLQLSATVLYEDLSTPHLAVDVSAGVSCHNSCSIQAWHMSFHWGYVSVSEGKSVTVQGCGA